MTRQAYLSLILHAHLPYVRHPEHDEFLEEDWLFEAITETYVPLLRMMDRLWADGVDFRLTMSITPPLCAMLEDELLRGRYRRRLDGLRELTAKLARDKRGTPFEDAAADAASETADVHRVYTEVHKGDLLSGFRSYQDRGRLEILTCGATHGLLPLLATDEARWAQIEVACRSYARVFGRRPRGIWLPECAYAPGLDRLLGAAGLDHFFVESRGLLAASPSPRFGLHRPVWTPGGPAAFPRDPECSRQVWSAEEGYPGDALYREFYRDAGWDLPYEQVRPYLHADGRRRPLGVKLHRITGKVALDRKEPYVPAWARERASDHAGNFLFNRQAQARHLRSRLGFSPLLVAPYDAELYGHWWSEGPRFLEMFFRKAACDQDELGLVTPREYLEMEPVQQLVQPAASSWGDKGTFEVWCNGANDWIWRHLHRAEEQMIEVAQRFTSPTALQRRALAQAGRELLLAQASDWAFIMTMDTTVPYAEKRTRDHLAHLHGLYLQLVEDRIEPRWLAELEARDAIFPDLDPTLFRSDALPARGGAAVASGSF